MKGRKPDVNKNNNLCVLLLDLRRHLASCAECRGAMGANDYAGMCDHSKRRIIDIARRWDANITGRLTARRKGDRIQFLCPNPGVHGSAYALTAEAVEVTAIQDALF